jgi:penicillin amidase
LLAELRAWDGVLRADSRQAAIYEAFRLALMPLIFQPALGGDLYRRYLERPETWQTALIRLLRDRSSSWWGRDGRQALVAQALEQARTLLVRRLGPDRSRWSWGRLHPMRFVHPLGRLPWLAWLFDATAPLSGGDLFTIDNGGFFPDTFAQVIVASYRQVIDLGDWDRSVAIHPTGQSGLPTNRHYKDFVSLWATGRYHPLLFSRARIEQNAEATLTLQPP